MKLIITESQYKKLHEQYNSEDENNIIGNPSENTLMIADFLLKQNLVDPRRMLISDDEIEIFGFEQGPFDYFNDNSMSMEIHTLNDDVYVNIQGIDNDDETDDEPRTQVYHYLAEVLSNFPFVNWYIEGQRI